MSGADANNTTPSLCPECRGCTGDHGTCCVPKCRCELREEAIPPTPTTCICEPQDEFQRGGGYDEECQVHGSESRLTVHEEGELMGILEGRPEKPDAVPSQTAKTCCDKGSACEGHNSQSVPVTAKHRDEICHECGHNFTLAASRESESQQGGWCETCGNVPFSKGRCGHSERYYRTEDGGKHIVCTICELETAEKALAEAQQKADKVETLLSDLTYALKGTGRMNQKQLAAWDKAFDYLERRPMPVPAIIRYGQRNLPPELRLKAMEESK